MRYGIACMAWICCISCGFIGSDARSRRASKVPALEIPNWDEASLKKVHATLLQLGETISDTRRMFGAAEHQVDPVGHLVRTALVWGGILDKDALYLPDAGPE
jgi:hypothetical protein